MVTNGFLGSKQEYNASLGDHCISAETMGQHYTALDTFERQKAKIAEN